MRGYDIRAFVSHDPIMKAGFVGCGIHVTQMLQRRQAGRTFARAVITLSHSSALESNGGLHEVSRLIDMARHGTGASDLAHASALCARRDHL